MDNIENYFYIYQLPIIDSKNIFEYNINPIFSLYNNNPLLKYGFNYYIHQNKNKMEIFINNIQLKKKCEIINPYEDEINENNSVDIKSFSMKYFNTDKIISRAFYKLWEILMMIPIIKNDCEKLNSIHLAEAPGAFIQAIIYYRKKFFKEENYKNDKYIATSIESNDKSIPEFKEFLNQFNQFNLWKYKNSDLTKLDIIKKFINDNENNKADLITADGGFNWYDENFQEQEAYKLLLSEIYCAIKVQKIGGNFVIKFFETFTELSLKLIDILRFLYTDVLIIKPLLSRPSNSEKYIICMNYKNNNYNIDKLYDILKAINNNPNKYINDFFPNYKISINLEIVNKFISTQLTNIQFKQINEIISYSKSNNFYGDVYNNYLTKRKDANNFWISMFYPKSQNDLIEFKRVLNSLIEKILNNNKDIIKLLNNKLIFNINYNIPEYYNIDSSSDIE